jgi:hypothetical protein
VVGERDREGSNCVDIVRIRKGWKQWWDPGCRTRGDRRNDRFSALNRPTDGKRFPYRIASCIKEKLHREHQKKESHSVVSIKKRKVRISAKKKTSSTRTTTQ